MCQENSYIIRYIEPQDVHARYSTSLHARYCTSLKDNIEGTS